MEKKNNFAAMHIIYDTTMPGGAYVPPIIEIVERKISLVQQLQTLCEGKSMNFISQSGRNIKEMIDIELRAIYEMILVDK